MAKDPKTPPVPQGAEVVSAEMSPAATAEMSPTPPGAEGSDRPSRYKSSRRAYGLAFVLPCTRSASGLSLSAARPAAALRIPAYELAILRLYQFFALRLVNCSSR